MYREENVRATITINMKLLGILVGLFLMFHVISSVPVDAEEKKVTTIHEDDGEPSEKFLVEVRNYFEQQKVNNPADRDKRHATNALNHGDTVALQTYERNHWLSCAVPPTSPCTRYPWPGMFMNGDEWTRLWGEVFQIYRAGGPGQVRVGDLVGIYYPRESGRWLGCGGTNCAKATCPGQPTTEHGFASEEHWYRCCEEVFKIYSNGKRDGAIINSGDDIMLYILHDELWVSQDDGNNIIKTPCAGTARPPPFSKFDRCYQETFTIWKKLTAEN